MIRVADYIIQRIYREGCQHIFTVTGRGALYLNDAVAAHSDIIPIFPHNEQAASYSAMAYAQANHKIGACLVSTGCASTNAITGVLCAWQDNIPMIVLSGQNKLAETTHHTKLPIRTYGQQEADIIALVKPITKYAVMIENKEDVVYALDKALYLAQAGRKGPVWIDIPLDVQNMRIDPDTLKQFDPSIYETSTLIPKKDLEYIQTLLNEAQRPIVLFGSGVKGATPELLQFIEDNNFPFIYSNSAVDVLPSKHDLSIGCAGAMAANRAANFALQNADVILNLGCRLSTMTTGDVKKFARQAKIIAVDVDPYEHQKFPNKIDHILTADVKHFLNQINLNKQTSTAWVNQCKKWKAEYPKCEAGYKGDHKVDLYELSYELEKSLDNDGIIVVDSGLIELILPTTIHFSKHQKCLHPAAQGAMGYALPAAIGAYYGSKGRQIATVVGDGSIMMNLQELQTIIHNQLPIKIFVVNNDCYAIIRKRQKDLFGGRTVGTDNSNGVSCPDFKKVAHCFGFHYEKIESTEQLKDNLSNILSIDKPVLCEILGKVDQGYIHSSYRRNEKGRFVQPPIEDQSPFLNRQEFLEQMIIDPIDT